MCHAGWLPDLAKWGGVASPAVRRHWCGCVVATLDSIRAASLELTVREKRIFKSLLERRDFWTDEQVCVLFAAIVNFLYRVALHYSSRTAHWEFDQASVLPDLMFFLAPGPE